LGLCLKNGHQGFEFSGLGVALASGRFFGRGVGVGVTSGVAVGDGVALGFEVISHQ
jgi:hypothetical protein